jgi:hypothetical protein
MKAGTAAPLTVAFTSLYPVIPMTLQLYAAQLGDEIIARLGSEKGMPARFHGVSLCDAIGAANRRPNRFKGLRIGVTCIT